MTTADADDREADAERSPWRRLWNRLWTAGRWVLDVFRGYSGSRHLNQRRRK